MRRRGELLRNAGVSSLRDLTRTSGGRLPRIVLAVDECHELFRDRMDKTQAEINAIVTRIAKEGRSQGVHLLLATQTLANANIPSELLNNVSDHYLLKCAQNDAEKLVRDSGKQTSALTTGWLLYAHEDKRELFQAYFAGRERMDENLRRILEKSASFPSEKGFFFSGKQRFPFDAGVLEAIALKSRRHPAVLLGRSVDLRQSPVGFPLKPGLGENALFFGINTQEQTLRVLFDAIVSLMVSFRHLALQGRFYVLNCLNLQEDSPAEALLHAMESYGCTVVEGADRGKLLATLAGEVRQRTARECVVAVLGQERFREVRLEMPLPSGEEVPRPRAGADGSHLGALGPCALAPRNGPIRASCATCWRTEPSRASISCCRWTNRGTCSSKTCSHSRPSSRCSSTWSCSDRPRTRP
ncbi:MAG: FtsK/SpoIIIE domain-containing protein [Alistipes sp.]